MQFINTKLVLVLILSCQQFPILADPAGIASEYPGLKTRKEQLDRQKDKTKNKWYRLQSVRDTYDVHYRFETKVGLLKPGHCYVPDAHGHNDLRTIFVFSRGVFESGIHGKSSSQHKDLPHNVPLGIRGQDGYVEQFLFHYQRSAYYQRIGMENRGYLLGFEGADPPTTVLPQEGNSFCVIGKHYFNSPELRNNWAMRAMGRLQTFDIGTHSYPHDYSKMNVFDPDASDTDTGEYDEVGYWKDEYNDPKKYTPNTTPVYTKARRTHCNIIPDKDAASTGKDGIIDRVRTIYQLSPRQEFRILYNNPALSEAETFPVRFDWEDTDAEGVFFHTRRTRYPNSKGDENPLDGNIDCLRGGNTNNEERVVDPEFWPSGYEPNPRYPYILDYINHPPHPVAKIRQMVPPYPQQTNQTQYGFLYRPAKFTDQPHSKCRNPYFIDVSEIEVDGVRLHNWLHITIYVRREFINTDPNRKNCPTGKMKYVMLEVRDQHGLPIGDFDNDLPCEKSGTCNCKSSGCTGVHGKQTNSMPCMFTPERAATAPGIFMYGVDKDNEGDPAHDEYFDEVHASWRFAQHTSSFATELHFATLIMESKKHSRYYNGRQTFYENPLKCFEADIGCVYQRANANSQDCNCNTEDACNNYFKVLSNSLTEIKDCQKDSPSGFMNLMGWHWNENSEFKFLFYGGAKANKHPRKRSFPREDLKAHYLYGFRKELCDKGPTSPLYKNKISGLNSLYERSTDTTTLGRSYFYEADYFNKKQDGYYSWSLQHMTLKGRPYGWNAQYRVLHPTIKTLGASDPFMYNQYRPVVLTSINCHKKLNPEYYKPNSSKPIGRMPLRKNFYKFRRDYNLSEAKKTCGKAHFSTWECHEIVSKKASISWASKDNSDFDTTYTEYPLESFVEDTRTRVNHPVTINKVYFGTFGTKEAYIPYYDPDYPDPLKIREELAKLPTLRAVAFEERCACPEYGSTLAPENVTKGIEMLQGRSAHASQMLFVWIVLIPLGLFIMRYYKETYSKVFIFREFWWYTSHVGLMVTSLLFIIGGVLSIEYKRDPDVSWLRNFQLLNDAARIHVVIGFIVILAFCVDVFHGFFRPFKIQLREMHILIHFVLGVVTVVLGGGNMALASFIPQGRMPCSALYTYIIFFGIQLLVYGIMELHYRHVDRVLALFPPRTYFPVMTVRVFHMNAPLFGFRMGMLCFQLTICLSFYFVLRYAEIEAEVRSCFADRGLDYDPDALF